MYLSLCTGVYGDNPNLTTHNTQYTMHTYGKRAVSCMILYFMCLCFLEDLSPVYLQERYPSRLRYIMVRYPSYEQIPFLRNITVTHPCIHQNKDISIYARCAIYLPKTGYGIRVFTARSMLRYTSYNSFPAIRKLVVFNKVKTFRQKNKMHTV